jgi:superfamily I DNA/RNA helicase
MTGLDLIIGREAGVAIPGVSISSDDDKAAEDEARLLYVTMTRATRELLVLESAVCDPAHVMAE